MLSTEECIALLNDDILQFENYLFLDCNTNTLEFPGKDLTLILNESQKRLMVCLLKNVNCKRKIINIVWYENHQRISDNNYHQLTFQLRSLFQRNGLPNNLLVTVPYYGLKLNEQLCRMLGKPQASTDLMVTNSPPATNKIIPLFIERKNIVVIFSFVMLSLFILWLK